jgi:glycosyltransferase involved in cell wall biosynthesis
MSNLIFITSRFPFEPGEPFIEAEFKFLYSNFERVIIITRNVTATKLRTIQDGVKVYRYNPTSTFYDYLILPLLIVRYFAKITTIIKDEISFRKEISRPISFKNKLILIKKIIKGLQLKDFIESTIKKEKIAGNTTFYSYWMNNGAHAISMLDKRDKIKISRAHRIDLYEEETETNYLPLLKYLYNNLDGIFFISEHGKEYFENRLRVISSKNQLSRAGVFNPFKDDIQKADPGFFRIVSCSSLIKVKRVDLIISALENLKADRKVVWNHFGEGVLQDELHDLAKRKLGHLKNIEFHFMGQIQNSDLLKFYAGNRIDLFINTSASEGIPASIMEAQSFGIPVIATYVGGVKEVVLEGTGILLPVDFMPEDLTKMIQLYVNMPEEEINKIRMEAFKNWDLNYNAAVNYPDFVAKVNSIFASVKNGNKS